MKFIILGSKINSLINAYYLAQKGHDITIIEDEKKSHDINKNVILLSNESFISNDSNVSFKSKLISIFQQKLQNKQFNNSVVKNITHFNELVANERIILQNQCQGLLYLYNNKGFFQKDVEDINSNKNYKIFNIDNFKETGLESEYIIENIPGIILSKNSFTIDKKSFLNDLDQICKNKYKVKFEKNLEIKNILNNHHKITGINTNKKVFVADQYIIQAENNNINLLKSIKINLKTSKYYQIIFFTKEDNVKNKIKYNIKDSSNNCLYYKNDGHYIVKIDISKDDYNDFNNQPNNEYFNRFDQLELLGIKDYKKIDHQLIRQEYFLDHETIQKSKKYHNLFLNSAHNSFDFNSIFDGYRILNKII
ncbi:hypothetical protein N8772_01015 [Rickettsiales bacterium]|nr:hypothetical protein [Rickettsiales bacterium]MDB2550456.1 hypothetical protein [Rickettsiales bacterium]